MFATLLGGLPAPATDEASPVEAAIRAQEQAGLEPITDGRLGDPGHAPVERWRLAAGLTDRAVKQSLPGPYTLGRRAAAAGRAGSREAATLAIADDLRRHVEGLAAAGCPLVEVEEAEAHMIGEDEAERALFREAHRRLTDGVTGTHLSLSIVGQAADAAGIETILSAPYASLAVDLIAGPDNWNIVTRAPQDRGIVVGALSGRPKAEPKEILVWGAHYAASTAARGIDRVGLGSAGSWTGLSWEEAVRRMRVLGEAARLASMPPSEALRRSLDPRALGVRRGAVGHRRPKPPRAPGDRSR